MRTWTLIGSSVLAVSLVGAARANILLSAAMETTAPLLPQNRVLVTSANAATVLPSWTVTQGTVDLVPNSRWAAQDGAFSVDMVGTTGPGEIRQTVATSPGTIYSLTFYLSANFERPAAVDETLMTKQLQVEALDQNGVVIDQPHLFSVTAGSRSATNMQYMLETITFTATGNTSTIVFTGLPSLGMPNGMLASDLLTGAVVDNISLDLTGGGPPGGTTIPEPASLAVLGAGSLLLLRRKARKAV